MTLSILPGTLTIVTGKVGSGKSVLLKGLLGELHTSRYIKRPTTAVAYCAETAWLTNSTIQQNILGPSPLDERWYETVIGACALDHDLAQMEGGDQSIVGSKGLSLCGGQKQPYSHM
jgi:ABC-type bacteriocin/lantibiotic exporter with double-glycine peptidase domain